MVVGRLSLTRVALQVQAAMESCLGKSVMSGVMGFGMGGLFGMFMASVRRPLPALILPPALRSPKAITIR